MPAFERLLQYGVSSVLAEKVRSAGLSVSKIRVLSKADLVSKYGVSAEEADELKKCIVRKPIDEETIELLLSRSNYRCCMCKGETSTGVIIHHIEEYEISQDNSYYNLAAICPTDHDRAHHGGLTLRWTKGQIRKEKESWEKLVETTNAQNAAKALKVTDEAVDYVNVMRIEAMCLQWFGEVPRTSITASLIRAGILNADRRFDEAYVRANLSGGQYLFDYVNSQETEHYRQLMKRIASVVDFVDLSEAARSGIRKLREVEGKYCYFIGGVSSKRPKRPIAGSEPIEWRYKARKVEIVWHGDAKYLMSSSSISRQGAVNKYIIYALARTVNRAGDGNISVSCSPLFIAQPSVSVDRTPTVAWRRMARQEQEQEEEEAFFDDADLDLG
ncbi:HNH endonuclease [Methylobacterium radiotolerans]|uniref:HNH endonuclease n=1 Tax=Methylobacterium radiotolerans TaxID=31998 RepID=UPI000D1F2914|nr:HNH endonuclease [Methylobacterium radiotolerans]